MEFIIGAVVLGIAAKLLGGGGGDDDPPTWNPPENRYDRMRREEPGKYYALKKETDDYMEGKHWR